MPGRIYLFIVLVFGSIIGTAQPAFVKRSGHQFTLGGKPYYYIGTNYWYGGLLGLDTDKIKGGDRLRKELDFLKANGVTNLRVLAGVEGSGQINGVQRVQPSLQPAKGIFDEKQLAGLDLLLSEMGKRNMKAVIFLSNNWEWSGGFLQYLNWNGLIADSVMRRKLNWDELRDYSSKFYTCDPCKSDYQVQVKRLLTRTNKITKKKYADDAAIMTWELANEPRPMRPHANDAYKKWITGVARYIKSLDKNHLVTTGHEGAMAVDGDMPLYEQVHAGDDIDYLTIHIWPKNWSWFKEETLVADFPSVRTKTLNYINQHVASARKLRKPLVVEEFGLPRDHHSFDVNGTTTLRDSLYASILHEWRAHKTKGDVINGINFWAFGGNARPKEGQVFWKDGDDYIGDPPMEEQGLNTVFDSDASTWNVIRSFAGIKQTNQTSKVFPADKKATKQTVSLYNNLKLLQTKGIMFGHQDALAYGVNWKYVPGKSDVKALVGDHPAVYGWELGNLELGMAHNLDSVPFEKMKIFIREVYERGGVNTISWHNTNPVTGKNAWDTTHGGVTAVLPGGNKNELYKDWLNKLAAFMHDLKGKNGEPIPVLFRPYHELTGNWFWWCKNTNTAAEFKHLWKYTADYLENQKNVHNLLYVYNTAEFTNQEEFLDRYPGDDYVDMVSFDAYQHGDSTVSQTFASELDRKLSILNEVASERKKLSSLAEVGYEKIPDAKWWTNGLWKGISNHKISYVLLWRNAGLMPNGNMHYYVPVNGHISAQNFKHFYQLDKTLFQSDVSKENLYK